METSTLLKELSKDWTKHNLEQYKTVSPFVYDQYKAYLKTGKYPYLDSVVKVILPQLPALTEHQKKNLHTQVYAAAGKYREEQKLNHRTKMLKDGWLLLNPEICEKALKNGQKLKLKGKITSDWLTQEIDQVCRVIHTDQSGYFLLPPRCRRKGYSLTRLTDCGQSDCFCKIA